MGSTISHPPISSISCGKRRVGRGGGGLNLRGVQWGKNSAPGFFVLFLNSSGYVEFY